MQNDLISRQALLKLFENLRDEHETNSISYNALYQVILLQPTAYDVEVVVSKMENQTEFLKDCTKYGNKDAEQMAKSYSTMMMYEVAEIVDDLIDCVRNGGKE